MSSLSCTNSDPKQRLHQTSTAQLNTTKNMLKTWFSYSNPNLFWVSKHSFLTRRPTIRQQGPGPLSPKEFLHVCHLILLSRQALFFMVAMGSTGFLQHVPHSFPKKGPNSSKSHQNQSQQSIKLQTKRIKYVFQRHMLTQRLPTQSLSASMKQRSNGSSPASTASDSSCSPGSAAWRRSWMRAPAAPPKESIW